MAILPYRLAFWFRRGADQKYFRLTIIDVHNLVKSIK